MDRTIGFLADQLPHHAMFIPAPGWAMNENRRQHLTFITTSKKDMKAEARYARYGSRPQREQFFYQQPLAFNSEIGISSGT